MFFEPADARCFKNIKRFLFFRWEGYHQTRVVDVSIWGDSSWNKYEVKFLCELCGARLRRFGVSHADMMRAGIDVDD